MELEDQAALEAVFEKEEEEEEREASYPDCAAGRMSELSTPS